MSTTGRALTGHAFTKGHGTENDFVILPDPDGELDLAAADVARICDRRAGIGADGVLRVVRAKAAGLSDVAAEWFMDYRNADGSVAEMCGNGVRVFARYLVDSGLAAPGELAVATRGGVKAVTLGESGDVTVDMGRPEVFAESEARVGGTVYRGLKVSMGNPHLACLIDHDVAALDLTREPAFSAADFPAGVNVEFFRPIEDRHVAMRVHERGSGETRSCGTGAVATAVAAAVAAGLDPLREASTWAVDVLGGRVEVVFDGVTSFLRGPAVLVADGVLR
ncbi:diaminopimelate epimerase [Actinocorallia sp. A-T 12471]|uniref:diaminopimelate epimerase n=1 Tax=Actinocorallia sp. A-T 12471 TaxID=3089813 RepID=UPI0029CC17DB|nr:diaminopimelate epimerase [Actinocorallia sp. A-T 12471]MDX6743465.1 diaminopimelate epimerase [Actinocorallia sp. A-T 12471]